MVDGVGVNAAFQHIYYTEVVDSQRVSEGYCTGFLCLTVIKINCNFGRRALHAGTPTSLCYDGNNIGIVR